MSLSDATRCQPLPPPPRAQTPADLLAREGCEEGERALGRPALEQRTVEVVLVAAAAPKVQHALPKGRRRLRLLLRLLQDALLHEGAEGRQAGAGPDHDDGGGRVGGQPVVQGLGWDGAGRGGVK